jgi:hypothetical protein
MAHAVRATAGDYSPARRLTRGLLVESVSLRLLATFISLWHAACAAIGGAGRRLRAEARPGSAHAVREAAPDADALCAGRARRAAALPAVRAGRSTPSAPAACRSGRAAPSGRAAAAPGAAFATARARAVAARVGTRELLQTAVVGPQERDASVRAPVVRRAAPVARARVRVHAGERSRAGRPRGGALRGTCRERRATGSGGAAGAGASRRPTRRAASSSAASPATARRRATGGRHKCHDRERHETTIEHLHGPAAAIRGPSPHSEYGSDSPAPATGG